MNGTGATRLLRSGFCSLTTCRPGGKLQLWTLSRLVLLLPTPGATNHPREGSQGWNRQLPLWGKAPAPTEMWRCLSIFFLSMEGSIQTSLFSWLRFPQNFLRLCHSHVFGGSNHGDVCCGSKSNPIWRFFFWWRQLDVVEFAFWFLRWVIWAQHPVFFFFLSFHTMEVLDTNKKSLRWSIGNLWTLYGYYSFSIQILILRDQRLINVGVFYMANSSGGHKVCKELLKGEWNHTLFFFPHSPKLSSIQRTHFSKHKNMSGIFFAGRNPFLLLS